MATKKKQLSPLMQQYVDLKKEYTDTILLFQVGDFYEIFYEDAKTASAFLGITLTRRGKSVDNESWRSFFSWFTSAVFSRGYCWVCLCLLR